MSLLLRAKSCKEGREKLSICEYMQRGERCNGVFSASFIMHAWFANEKCRFCRLYSMTLDLKQRNLYIFSFWKLIGNAELFLKKKSALEFFLKNLSKNWVQHAGNFSFSVYHETHTYLHHDNWQSQYNKSIFYQKL